MKDLSGKTAVITGAASGIGRACAESFSKRGMRVVIADLNEERGAETVAAIADAGGQAVFQRCDVSNEADLLALRDKAVATFGGVQLLMNNAAMLPVGGLAATDMAMWRRVYDVNFFSVVRAIQIFMDDLKATGDAHIVNTASAVGLFAYDPAQPVYSSSKAAVINLSESLALALKPHGIGVTCLCPGAVVTNIVEQIKPSGDLKGFGNWARANLPLGTAEEAGERVAEAVLAGQFLVHTDDTVQGHLQRRAADPDGFLSDLVAFHA